MVLPPLKRGEMGAFYLVLGMK